MADDKRNSGARDRSTLSADERYELAYFAKKHDLSREEAQALIDRVGNGREALEAAVADRAKPAPKRRGRPPKSASSGSGTSSTKRKSGATNAPELLSTSAVTSLGDTVSGVVVPVAAAADAAAKPVVKPVAKSIAPIVKGVAATSRKATAAVTRRPGKPRKAASGGSKAASRRTGAALGAKMGITGRTASLVGAAAAGLMTGLAVSLGRKIIVQAPSALAGDWLDTIKLEHRMALALFDKLQATSSGDADKRTFLLTQLKHALAKHAFTEENVIYPALRAWGDKADADKLNHDHGYVKQNLYDLEEMDNTLPAFLEKVASFRADIAEHIREEEDAIFPPLHAALGKGGNAKVTAQANKEGFKLA